MLNEYSWNEECDMNLNKLIYGPVDEAFGCKIKGCSWFPTGHGEAKKGI